MKAAVNQELQFFTEQFEIKPENKLTVFRYNVGTMTPFCHVSRSIWNYEAKSVKTSNFMGIYGFTKEQVCLGRGNYFLNAFQDSISGRENICFIELEVDRTKIFYKDDAEIIFPEANIVGIVGWEQMKNIFPIYTELFEVYSKVLDTKFENEELYYLLNHHIEFARRLGDIIPSIGNEAEEIHGIAHGIRVERNGNQLCQLMGITNKLVRPFAYVHDFCRVNDGTDPEHGLRAANHIEAHRELFSCRFSLNEREIDLLKYACQHHTEMIKSEYDIVNVLFDADRLDLPRVGTHPDPNLMATTSGGIYAALLTFMI